jgi:TetR/AcrR family transcriptional regulator, regulator of autoinduction and epiphytic fitness
MSNDMPSVKTRANRRREQAAATRRRIVDAAYRSFSEAGYASTTMDAVAAAAGVAVQTVYHVFNTKAALLKEVVTVAAAGESDPPLEPAWLADSLGSGDGRRGMAVMIEHGISSGARVAPLIASIHGAESTDPSFADYWEGACAVRRASAAALVARLDELGQLRPGLDQQRAADIFYAAGSHESFSSFTRTCGWSVEEVKAWYYELFCDQLLSDDRRPGGDGSERPTEGLSFDHLVSESGSRDGVDPVAT